MTLELIRRAIDRTDSTIRALIESGRRSEIMNERYFHHMFSSYFLRESETPDWDSLPILPEYPTNFRFSRRNVDINDPEFTRENAINFGTSGNLDFLVPGDPDIAIEWKGPENCPEQDVVEAFLKLLNRNTDDIKVFAALYITKSGSRDHYPKLVDKIQRSIDFVSKTLEIPNINEQNLFLFVRSHYEGGCHDVCWGSYSEFCGIAT